MEIKSRVETMLAQGAQTLAALQLSTQVLIFGIGLVFTTPAIGQPVPHDYLIVRPGSDYYDYRFHPSYARADQLLRTVERYHLGQSQQRMREKAYPQAFSEFEFILTQFPNHPQALLGMLNLCLQVRMPKCTPTEFIDRAIAANPEAAGTYSVQGVYFSRTGRYPAAIESYQQALSLQPDSANAHYNIGLAYFETKQYELANKHAQQAYSLRFPLPALREKLQRSGHWKAVEPPAEAGLGRPRDLAIGADSSQANQAKGEIAPQPSSPGHKKE